MTIAKSITKTLDISVEDVRIDLTATIRSYDLTDTQFIFEIKSSNGMTANLTGSTAIYIVEYVHNSQTYAIQGDIDIIGTDTLSFNLPEDLKGYSGTVLIGIYVKLTDGTKIDIKDIAVRIEPSIMDKDIDFSAKTYFKDFESIKAEVVLEGEKAKTQINAVVSNVNGYADTRKQAIDNIVSDVQSTGDTAKADIKATLPTLQGQVSELKSDLDDYIMKEKILTRGVESGWYGISGNTITENEHPTWTRTHLAAPFSFNSLRFEIKDKIKCVFTIKNSGKIDFYDTVGRYDLDISDCSDVYINFFGNTLVSDYYLYYSYKPYESGYIKFKVRVNQRVVTPNDTANKLIDTESISNVTCHLKLPTSYRPYGKPTKLLMICHGAGRGITIPHPTDNGTWEDNENYNALIDTFVNAGYAIFDCNGYKDDFWGCNFWGAHRGVEAWRKAYDYIVKNYNVEDNVSIYGFSMGGLTALNLVMNGFPNVKVVALGSPVLDPQKAFENGQAVIMGGAYGMGSTWEPIKARGCSPIERIVTIGNTEMLLQNLPPIKIWYGSTEQDEIVNKNYASRFVNAIINGGGYATYREVEGENHRICLGAVQYINNEYLYWINRFNN